MIEYIHNLIKKMKDRIMKFKQFLTNLIYKYQRFMYGRYGFDELSYALILLSFLLTVLSNIKGLWFLYFVAVVPIVLSILRCLSKNITLRCNERAKFMKIIGPCKSWFKLLIKKVANRKTHRFFKCPQCNSTLRVPKGRGKINITCPKCGNKMIKKT